MTVEPTLAQYRALAAFRVELRRFLAFSARAAAEAGIAPQQYQALLAIKGHGDDGPPSITELAAQLFVRQHTAVELVKRLEAAGLVARMRGPADRRVVLVRLTARAEAMLAALASVHLKELGQRRVSIAAQLDRMADRGA